MSSLYLIVLVTEAIIAILLLAVHTRAYTTLIPKILTTKFVVNILY